MSFGIDVSARIPVVERSAVDDDGCRHNLMDNAPVRLENAAVYSQFTVVFVGIVIYKEDIARAFKISAVYNHFTAANVDNGIRFRVNELTVFACGNSKSCAGHNSHAAPSIPGNISTGKSAVERKIYFAGFFQLHFTVGVYISVFADLSVKCHIVAEGYVPAVFKVAYQRLRIVIFLYGILIADDFAAVFIQNACSFEKHSVFNRDGACRCVHGILFGNYFNATLDCYFTAFAVYGFCVGMIQYGVAFNGDGTARAYKQRRGSCVVINVCGIDGHRAFVGKNVLTCVRSHACSIAVYVDFFNRAGCAVIVVNDCSIAGNVSVSHECAGVSGRIG